MIPITSIVDDDLYSQDDASFLLGDGFTEKAARETIRTACQSGQLEGRQWRKRWWFEGRQFKLWVRRWYGPEIKVSNDDDASPIARVGVSGYNRFTDSEPARRRRGRR